MISWNEVWKEKVIASGMVRDYAEHFNDGSPAWEWWSMPRWWEDGRSRASSMEADASWTMLEIGPGPGIVTLPMARKVRSVTAIEPSRLMISILKKKARDNQLANIQIIRSAWEQIQPEDVGGHDLVVASDSLFFVDLGEAILKMNRLAKKRVHLFWMSDMPTWERIRAELVPRISGSEYIPFPKANIVFNVLQELGVHPDFRIMDPGSGFEPHFFDRDQAVSYVSSCLGSIDGKLDQPIRQFVDEHLKADGSLDVQEKNEYAWISWPPSNLRHEATIDYDEHWRQWLFNCGYLINPPYFESSAIAARYDNCDFWWALGEMNVNDIDLDSTWSAIDIGSGPGTLTVPLAKRLRKVTAVEPSQGMLPLLKKNIRERGLSNVRIIHSRWEDIRREDIGIHDVVIASFCLQMPRIKEALRKMNDLAREQVYIFWFSGPPIWERILADIGKEAVPHVPAPMPKADLLFGLLCSMGLNPEVKRIRDFSSMLTFRNLSEAKQFFKEDIGIDFGEEDRLLEEYLQKALEKKNDMLILKDDPSNYVRITWTPLKTGELANQR